MTLPELEATLVAHFAEMEAKGFLVPAGMHQDGRGGEVMPLFRLSDAGRAWIAELERK